MAILHRNAPAFIPAAAYETLLERLDGLFLGAVASDRDGNPEVEVSLGDP